MMTEAEQKIEVFQYVEGPVSTIPTWPGFVEPVKADEAQSSTDDEEQSSTPSEQQQKEEAQLSFEKGRERGIQEGRQVEREAQSAARLSEDQDRAKQIAELVQGFSQERDHYLRAVEHEVVSLALAIAARVLRHESQMDPLFLTGAVRVALGQLSNSTEVRLLVPDSDLNLWRETIAHIPNLTIRPTVVAGGGMHTGECKVETSVGSVNLGAHAQLEEIERSLFDTTAQSVRPTLRANSVNEKREA